MPSKTLRIGSAGPRASTRIALSSRSFVELLIDGDPTPGDDDHPAANRLDFGHDVGRQEDRVPVWPSSSIRSRTSRIWIGSRPEVGSSRIRMSGS